MSQSEDHKGSSAQPETVTEYETKAGVEAPPLEDISQAELRKRIFNLIWPVTTDSILQMLVTFVSSGLVGRLGSLVTSVVGLSSRITQFAWALFLGIATGTTVLVAREVGAKDPKGARHTAVQAIMVSIPIVAVLTVAMFIFAEPILKLLNAEGELLTMAMEFLSIAMFTMPFLATCQVVGGVARGMGDTKTPMMISFVVNIINAILGWAMIYGQLGLPAFGVNGAAWAQLISQAVGAMLAIFYISSSKLSIGLRLSDFRNFSFPEAKRILRIGIPSSAESVFWQMATMFMMGLIVTFGTVPLAAHQLGLQAESISYMPANGFGVAATTLIGHSLGALNPDLGKRYFKEIMRWGILVSSFASLILLFGGNWLLGLLTNEQEVIELGAHYLFLMGFTQVPALVTGVIGGTLRSAGDVRAPMYISAVGMWIFRIPLSFYIGASLGPLGGMHWGIHGVWWAMMVDLFVRLALAIWRYSRLRWDIIKAV